MAVVVASAGDFEEWFALFEAVAREGRWIATEAPVDRAQRRQWFQRLLDDPDARIWVARDEGRLVGALGAEIEHGVAGFGMMVAADARGRGIGSALVDACVAWAAAQDAHKVAIQVWPHNDAARRLYERKGFVVEGRLRRHYRRRNGELWDALAMGLVLDGAGDGAGGP